MHWSLTIEARGARQLGGEAGVDAHQAEHVWRFGSGGNNRVQVSGFVGAVGRASCIAMCVNCWSYGHGGASAAHLMG